MIANRADSWPRLKDICVFGDNWLGRRLKSSSSKKHILILIWIVLGLIPQLLFLLAGKIDGALFLDGQSMGRLEDYVNLSYFIFIPGCASIAVVLFPRFPEILGTMADRAVLFRPSACPSSNSEVDGAVESISHADGPGVTPKQFDSILSKCEDTLRGKGDFKYVRISIHVGALLWVTVQTISHWYYPDTLGHDVWASRHHMASFVTLAVHDFVVFGLIFPFVVWRFVAILHCMRSVCRDLTEKGALIVRPLYPDQAGGLGFFGKYSLAMVTILIPPLATIMLYIYSGNITLILMMGITVYIMLFAFAFFYPLSGAHEAMSRFKNKEVKTLSSEFSRAYDTFIKNVAKKKRDKLQGDTAIVDSLDRLYSRAERMPVWPFDTATLTKFIGILAGLAGSIWVNWVVSNL